MEIRGFTMLFLDRNLHTVLERCHACKDARLPIDLDGALIADAHATEDSAALALIVAATDQMRIPHHR